MYTISSSPFPTTANIQLSTQVFHFPTLYSSSLLLKPLQGFYPLCYFPRNPIRAKVSSNSSGKEKESSAEDEWLKRLPDKKKSLYSHSLPCIEAWLRNLGLYQSKDDRAVWLIEKLDWHAHLSLDITDLCIRYLKSGPGNLGKDMERRFSYALSREDIENAVLGGP